MAASKRGAFFFAEIEIDPEQGRQNSWMPDLAQNINYLYEVLHNLCADNPGKLFSFLVRAKPGADLESLLVISDFFRSLDEASPECSVLAYLAYD